MERKINLNLIEFITMKYVQLYSVVVVDEN